MQEAKFWNGRWELNLENETLILSGTLDYTLDGFLELRASAVDGISFDLFHRLDIRDSVKVIKGIDLKTNKYLLLFNCTIVGMNWKANSGNLLSIKPAYAIDGIANLDVYENKFKSIIVNFSHLNQWYSRRTKSHISTSKKKYDIVYSHKSAEPITTTLDECFAITISFGYSTSFEINNEVGFFYL